MFHNGLITNFKELLDDLELKGKNTTDSEVIYDLIAKNINEGSDLKDAIKQVCETKLIGTWRLAIHGL